MIMKGSSTISIGESSNTRRLDVRERESERDRGRERERRMGDTCMGCAYFFPLGLIETEVIKADLKWVFAKYSGSGVYTAYNFLPRKRELVFD